MLCRGECFAKVFSKADNLRVDSLIFKKDFDVIDKFLAHVTTEYLKCLNLIVNATFDQKMLFDRFYHKFMLLYSLIITIYKTPYFDFNSIVLSL